VILVKKSPVVVFIPAGDLAMHQAGDGEENLGLFVDHPRPDTPARIPALNFAP
jgi:hypothetical protein